MGVFDLRLNLANVWGAPRSSASASRRNVVTVHGGGEHAALLPRSMTMRALNASPPSRLREPARSPIIADQSLASSHTAAGQPVAGSHLPA